MGLSRIVCRPVLAIGGTRMVLVSDGDAIGPFLALDDEFDGVDMLARLLVLLEVGASAERLAVEVTT